MREPHVNDRVHLRKDIPELLLHRGETGVVRSTWFAPERVYEVGFKQPGVECAIRALLVTEQVEVEGGGEFGRA